MLLKVQGVDWYNLEHHPKLTSHFRAAGSTFCEFQENHTPKQPKCIVYRSKKLFSNFDEGRFLARRMCFMYFGSTLCIQKMITRVQANFWYKFKHHTTLRNGFSAAESNFCRFWENDTPKQQKLNIGCWKKCFYQTLVRMCFWLINCVIHIF